MQPFSSTEFDFVTAYVRLPEPTAGAELPLVSTDALRNDASGDLTVTDLVVVARDPVSLVPLPEGLRARKAPGKREEKLEAGVAPSDDAEGADDEGGAPPPAADLLPKSLWKMFFDSTSTNFPSSMFLNSSATFSM